MGSNTRIIKNVGNIKVSPNEYLSKYTLWRNLQKLIDNDISLAEFKNQHDGEFGIGVYSDGNTYQYGDLLWFLYPDKKKLVLMRSTRDDNTRNPLADGMSFQDNGWETLSQDADIGDLSIFSRLLGDIQQMVLAHEADPEYHPYGELTDENVDTKLLKSDMSNRNPDRVKYQFPFTTGFFPKGEDDVVLNGSYRYYDNGLVEYDIVYRFGYAGKERIEGHTYSVLTCNNVKFDGGFDNSRYFLDESAHSIFSGTYGGKSQIGDTMQRNRNDFVNVYFAKIQLPIPFKTTKYMVFSSDMLSQQVGRGVVGAGRNQITFCNKGLNQITAVLVTYPRENFDDLGYNSENGGLAVNSFRCRLVGMARARNE